MTSGVTIVVNRSSFPVLTSVSAEVSTRRKSATRKKGSAGRGCAGLLAVEAIVEGSEYHSDDLQPFSPRESVKRASGRGRPLLFGEWVFGCGLRYFARQIGNVQGGEILERQRF